MADWEETSIGLLWAGDCFDAMADLERGTVDAVLCDLPYGTTACSWDSVLPGFQDVIRRRGLRGNQEIAQI